jgi:hypothetical protein
MLFQILNIILVKDGVEFILEGKKNLTEFFLESDLKMTSEDGFYFMTKVDENKYYHHTSIEDSRKCCNLDSDIFADYIYKKYREIYVSIEERSQLAVFHEHVDKLKYFEFKKLSYMTCLAHINAKIQLV